MHGFQPISKQRSAAVLLNWFRRHTANQIEQEQLIHEGAAVLQKLMIKKLNRKLIAVILTNADTSVKSMNCYSTQCVKTNAHNAKQPRLKKLCKKARAHEQNQGNIRT